MYLSNTLNKLSSKIIKEAKEISKSIIQEVQVVAGTSDKIIGPYIACNKQSNGANTWETNTQTLTIDLTKSKLKLFKWQYQVGAASIWYSYVDMKIELVNSNGTLLIYHIYLYGDINGTSNTTGFRANFLNEYDITSQIDNYYFIQGQIKLTLVSAIKSNSASSYVNQKLTAIIETDITQ